MLSLLGKGKEDRKVEGQVSINLSESILCPLTQTSKFTHFFLVIYKKIQDKCNHGLASHDASGGKPGQHCFADGVTLCQHVTAKP